MKKSHQENNQSKHRTERERRWWRNRTGRPPSPQQMYQNICMWNSSHRTSLEHCQKTPDLQKGKPISEWGRAKDKSKKGDKEFGMGTCILGTESWRRKGFCILGKRLTSKVRGGELQNRRGKHSETGVPKAKWRNFTTEIARGSHACGKQGLGGNGGWLPWGYSEGANTTQSKRTRKNPGTTSVC